ncbi:MAG: head GIN domain-containing protein [Chitinophagaceae bacterium]
MITSKMKITKGGLRVLMALAFVMFMTILTSCEKIKGEGPVVMQERTMQSFHSVSAGVSGRIRYTVSPACKVELHAQQNILDILETFVSSDELIIKFKNGVNVRSYDDIDIHISGPSPESVSLSGDASLEMPGTISGDRLQLRVSGSGNIEVGQVSLTNKLEATVTGSGNINVAQGTVKQVNLRISGSGNIRSTGVSAQEADAEISGSGNIRVKATDKLNARISGSGSVYYTGAPLLTTNISGSGSVKPM